MRLTVRQAMKKGWQLSRCVFVGAAGMVSAENLSTLARRQQVHRVHAAGRDSGTASTETSEGFDASDVGSHSSFPMISACSQGLTTCQ